MATKKKDTLTKLIDLPHADWLILRVEAAKHNLSVKEYSEQILAGKVKQLQNKTK